MNKKTNIHVLVRLAVLIAIILLLEITNLGYIRMPSGLELTILQVPVLVGAIVMGPAAGAVLGGVFGLTSFWQCISSKSAFGAVLLGINPIYTFIVCVVSRVLMGWLCGLIFKALYQIDKTKLVSFACASLSGAVLNTLFFMSSLILLFGSTEFIMGIRGDLAILPFLVAFVGFQGLIEAIVCFVVGTAISKGIYKYVALEPKEFEND